MNHAEMLMRRRNVHAFIKADPVNIVIQRLSAPTPSPAGGLVPGTPSNLPPQEARIVLNKRRYNNGVVNAEAGEIPHTDYLLIMEYMRDVQVDDIFHSPERGGWYKVTGIYGNRKESFLCSIDFLGETNRNA